MSARTQEAPNCARPTRAAEPIAKTFQFPPWCSLLRQVRRYVLGPTDIAHVVQDGAEGIDGQSHCQCAKHTNELLSSVMQTTSGSDLDNFFKPSNNFGKSFPSRTVPNGSHHFHRLRRSRKNRPRSL